MEKLGINSDVIIVVLSLVACTHIHHHHCRPHLPRHLLFLHLLSGSSSSQESQGGDLILTLHLFGFPLTVHHLLHSSLHLSSSSPFILFVLAYSFLTDSNDVELLLLHHVIPSTASPTPPSHPPTASSFPTLLPRLNLSFDPSLISHPDLFVCGSHIVHDLSHLFPLTPSSTKTPSSASSDPKTMSHSLAR